ncbi:MAG: hypothetical protein IJ920_10645 [Paludibacteraceae bacterium]|nr:hypothetical protein [Paludibacteraceae bacterium]
MKKFLVAMMALCAVTMGFTSCEKKADPATQPIAGHTYRCTVTENEMTAYTQFTFHTNFKCTYESLVPPATEIKKQDLLVWEMAGKVISIKGAKDTNMDGVEIYHGIYNADKNSIDISITAMPEQEPMTFVLYR